MIKLHFYLALVFCLLPCKLLKAQNSSLIIDAIENIQFIVYVNNDQQNFIPGARVVLTNLPQNAYNVKIVDPQTNEIYTEDEIKLPPSVDLIYALHKDADEIYKLAFTSSRITTSYNTLKVQQDDCYVENSKVLIHGPYAPMPETRNFIVSWGSEQVETVERQIEYPVEVDVTLYVCKNSYLNAVCPTSVSDSKFDDLFSALDKNNDEEEKLNTIKQIIVNLQRNNSCFTALQIKNLMELFSNDKSKLVIAELAKEYLADPTNQNIIKEAFDNPKLFSSIN